MSACDVDLTLPPSYQKLKRELELWAKLRTAPLTATFELTPYCNLRCPMCYVRLDPAAAAKQGKLMTGKQWLEIARQSRDLGTLYVTLTGGEPLLHPDFWEIYNGLTEMGMLVTVLTNGCLIDGATVERFRANPPVNMKISMYGASDETYEAMCGVKNGFTRLDGALNLLKEADIPFFCTATVVNENRHDLLAMYKYAQDKGIPFFHTIAVTNSARGALSDPLSSRLRYEDLVWTLENLEAEKRPIQADPFAYCSGNGTFYFVTWHGHMQYCSYATKPFVQLTEPFDMVGAWEQMRAQVDAIRLPAACGDCAYSLFCRRCPGLLCSESGDPEKVSPSFCAQAEFKYRMYEKLKAEKTENNPEKA